MDSASIGILATNVISAITPLLVSAAKNTAEKILPQAAEDLYQAIKNRLTNKPAAAEALADLEEAPSDEDIQAAVRRYLQGPASCLVTTGGTGADLPELRKASKAVARWSIISLDCLGVRTVDCPPVTLAADCLTWLGGVSSSALNRSTSIGS